MERKSLFDCGDEVNIIEEEEEEEEQENAEDQTETLSPEVITELETSTQGKTSEEMETK